MNDWNSERESADCGQTEMALSEQGRYAEAVANLRAAVKYTNFIIADVLQRIGEANLQEEVALLTEMMRFNAGVLSQTGDL